MHASSLCGVDARVVEIVAIVGLAVGVDGVVLFPHVVVELWQFHLMLVPADGVSETLFVGIGILPVCGCLWWLCVLSFCLEWILLCWCLLLTFVVGGVPLLCSVLLLVMC